MEKGQGLVEYALIVFLVAVVIVVVLTLLGLSHTAGLPQPEFEELKYVSEPVRVRDIEFSMRDRGSYASGEDTILLAADPEHDGIYNVYYLGPKTDIVYREIDGCFVVFDSESREATLERSHSGC